MSTNFFKKELYIPNEIDFIKILQIGLERSFKNVEVNLVDCPDLTQPPFYLSTKGLCGFPAIADIGGVSYLMPIPKHDKIYNLEDIVNKMDYKHCNILGAGAAPSHVLGNLAELIIDVSFNKQENVNNSYIAQIDKQGNSYELKKFNCSYEAKHLVNMYASLGNPGKVIQIKVSNRINKEGFVECLQKILFEKYKLDKASETETCIGLGGVFLLQSGSANIHVMPKEYSNTTLSNIDMINKWLRFFEISSPLICLGYLVSHDPGWKLRTEHFHCFNLNQAGGHFHHDITPSEASYLGYFQMPEFLYRFDMPSI